MKTCFLLLVISFWNLGTALPIRDRILDPVALFELSFALSVPQDTDIVEEAQKWLRRPDQERWEMAEIPFQEALLILNWAEKQGLFADWRPVRMRYDKAVILGATTSRMQMRLDYLKQLWLEGVRFDEMVWLTGDRPLDEKADALLDRCQNESEAARLLWEETDLPQEMRMVPLTFIAVPMKAGGSFPKRPNTEDTIIAWLNTNPGSCTALFVSDQPFCGYQFAVVKTCLPASIEYELVGPGVDPASHPAAAAITLDSIARWIYQERLFRNKEKPDPLAP